MSCASTRKDIRNQMKKKVFEIQYNLLKNLKKFNLTCNLQYKHQKSMVMKMVNVVWNCLTISKMTLKAFARLPFIYRKSKFDLFRIVQPPLLALLTYVCLEKKCAEAYLTAFLLRNFRESYLKMRFLFL